MFFVDFLAFYGKMEKWKNGKVEKWKSGKYRIVTVYGTSTWSNGSLPHKPDT